LKIKLLNWLLIIDILTVLLVLAIWLVPGNAIRIVLGLPFLLFFPGYTLVAALFPGNKDENPQVPADAGGTDVEKNEPARKKGGIDNIERTALSFGMSIAVTALLGLGLNYTPWGIRLVPVIIAIAAFILIMSVIALIRRDRLGDAKITTEYRLKMPGWEGSALNKALTVILAVAILGAIGTLGYTVAKPKVGERFSEFYILGSNGKAENYPSSFVLTVGAVSKVGYGGAATQADGTEGKLTLGIVNQEQKETVYSVALQIDGQAAAISYNGSRVDRVEQIKLQQGEKWEQEIGFTPQHTGDKQKVELFLYKDGASVAEESLHIWVDVKGQ
jgi:uncharacterized membrane protein